MVQYVDALQSLMQGQQYVDGLFQNQARRTAGGQMARGNLQGAANTLYQQGDLQAGAALQDRQAAQVATQRADQDRMRAEQLQQTTQVVNALRRVRDGGGNVAEELPKYREAFIAMGTDPQQLQQIEAQVAANPAFLDQIAEITGQQLRELSFQKAGDQLLVFEQGNPDPVRQFNAPRQPISVGGVLVDPNTYEPLVDTRRPEYFKTENGDAPAIVGVTPQGQAQTIWQGQSAGPEVRTLAPQEVAAMGLQPGVYQADRSGRITPVSGQGGDRLSAGQQRQVENYYQEIQGVENINAELGRFDSMIANGQLNLNPASNAIGGIRNALGASDENSRNLAEFRSTLERVRNDSLRLNNGVQTEGDAQRAWNELVSNLNDERVVRRQLARIRTINDRARAFRQERIDALEGGSRQPAAPQSRSRANGPPEQAIGSRENPYRLNPSDPNVGWNRIPSGGYFRHPDGSIRRKP